ncbi:phosphotransferase family protein [Azospirillum sp. Marseille-Q6669]
MPCPCRRTASVPLPAPADPVAATLAQVERQAVWFERAGLAPNALALLERELDDARAFRCAAPVPITLVGSDVHPGNFLIDAAGKAWFTDLEKAQYGHPAIDLAHASLYTSTMWEREVAAVLAPDEVAAFHAAWEAAVPPALAEAVRPWRRPLRRLTWLRTLSWMARWRVEGRPSRRTCRTRWRPTWTPTRSTSSARTSSGVSPPNGARTGALSGRDMRWIGPQRG